MPEKGVSYLLAHIEKVEFAKLFGQKLEMVSSVRKMQMAYGLREREGLL